MTKLTIAQAAAVLGIPARTVQGRIRRGQLAADRVGPARRGILLIEAEAVEAERTKIYRIGRPTRRSTMDTTGFNANTLSSAARKACKALRFTPRHWEPINADRPATYDEATGEYPVMRLWNSKREIVLTNRELAEAHMIL